MRERNTKPWYQRAECQDDDPDLFNVSNGAHTVWETGDRRGHLRRTFATAARCDRCPVAADCAQDAVLTKDHGMIRGGIPVPVRGLTTRTPMHEWARIGLLMVAGGIDPATAREIMLESMPPQKTGGGQK